MSELLDEVARTLATPMPRRRALRTLGGALAAVALPGLLRPGTARASRVTKASIGTFRPSTKLGVCEKSCPGHSPVPCLCKGPTHGCYETCGVPGSTCCCLKGTDGKNAGVVACPPGYRCGSPPRTSNCVCVNNCGGACCGLDQFCANPRQGLCCKEGQRGCGLQCCQPNEECKKVRVGTASTDICTKRCPQGQAWCGGDKCCPPKWHCVNERSGLCKRCRRNEEECGTKCCDKRTSRCCGKAGCCPKSRSCCVTGDKQVCCPPRHGCAIPILRGDIGIKRGTLAICCPNERLSRDPKLCCPLGQVALNTPGFRNPPPGISPFCCPRGQVCQSGGRSVCVDTRSDPANCGSCGNVCASGICNGGVCALP